ncbi:restriction endonuclease subunit S [Clostridium perfringens]|uniref:restriction endonuclease subunit S n=1 Tax=Clostridium perfringens TaxID=1502 RepID=UPI0018D5B5A7|nr:restriction endonuclease subunit S [Clostridium perfringens]QPS31277.1 restriction endonuclease subunit S [Clostridium perfringens]STB46058.1 type I restriction-modification enzyme, S subunit [Clostridium perfringens]
MKKEAREGYKMTELGEIPSGWKVNKLKNILEICYGKSQKEVETENGIYKILGTGGVIGYTNEYLWNKPSVLIGRKGTIDKPMYIEEPFWTVDTLFYTKINNENNVKWIYYYLNNIDLKKYNEATGVPSLSVNNLNNIKVITPSLKEQEKIAEILSTVDKQIDNTEKLIQKNEDLKKGLMQQLLTKGIGHKEFKETEIGVIPNNWKLFKLGDIVKFEGGSQPPKKYFSNDYSDGMVRLIQIRDYKTDNFKIYAPKDLCRKFCDKNDVMIGRYGPPIFQILRGLDGAYNVALIKAIPDEEKMIKDYLFYFLKNEKLFNLIDSLSQRTSGQTGIDMDALKNYLVQLPTLLEQKRIVSILEVIDGKIENYKIKKESLEELKKGLMEQLLTGKIRVI